MGLLCKETINVVVRYFSKKGGVVGSEGCRFGEDFLNCGGDLEACPLAAYLNETDGRAFVEYDNQQAAADNTDVNTFAFTFMDDSGEFILADEFRHAGGRRYITGGQRRKACRIHVADVAMKRYRLAVSVN